VTQQLLEYGIHSTWNDNNEYEIWDKRARISGFGTPGPPPPNARCKRC
jgi:alpha-glucosidase